MTYYRTTTRTSVSNAQSVLQKMVEDEKNLEFAGLLAQIRDDISRLTLTKEWGDYKEKRVLDIELEEE